MSDAVSDPRTRLAGLVTGARRCMVLSAAERWLVELGEWRNGRRPEPPNSEAWL